MGETQGEVSGAQGVLSGPKGITGGAKGEVSGLEGEGSGSTETHATRLGMTVSHEKRDETLMGRFPNLLQYTDEGPDPPVPDAGDITPPLDCVTTRKSVLSAAR